MVWVEEGSPTCDTILKLGAHECSTLAGFDVQKLHYLPGCSVELDGYAISKVVAGYHGAAHTRQLRELVAAPLARVGRGAEHTPPWFA
eukprot:scaffold2268_cov349-Prasinococcus_capsulatus_cf.AAC.3